MIVLNLGYQARKAMSLESSSGGRISQNALASILRCWTGFRVLRRLVLMGVIAGTSTDDYRGEEQDRNFFSDGFH